MSKLSEINKFVALELKNFTLLKPREEQKEFEEMCKEAQKVSQKTWDMVFSKAHA